MNICAYLWSHEVLLHSLPEPPPVLAIAEQTLTNMNWALNWKLVYLTIKTLSNVNNVFFWVSYMFCYIIISNFTFYKAENRSFAPLIGLTHFSIDVLSGSPP